ncbi:MAG: glycosyltransferase family 2 protein [bacterium]|nr:glycosyltransferase family 2 protein [bacterium]
MKCSIIIVTYNAKEYTDICLKKLLVSTLDEDIELVLFDNNSTDGVKNVINALAGQKNIKVVLNDINLGFAKGNNEAIKYAKGEYIFLLNPDTEIDMANVRKLINFLNDNPKVGVVGPKIYDSTGLVQESYGFDMTILSEFLGKIFGSVYIQNLPIIRNIRMQYFDKRELTTVGWIGGAALMMRNTLFKEIGGIDPYFFYSAGDMVDLCASVKKVGFDVVFYPHATMTHKGGASNVKDKVQALKSSLDGSLYFFKKHRGAGTVFLMKLVYAIISFIKAVTALILAIFKDEKIFFDISKSHLINSYWLIRKLFVL